MRFSSEEILGQKRPKNGDFRGVFDPLKMACFRLFFRKKSIREFIPFFSEEIPISSKEILINGEVIRINGEEMVFNGEEIIIIGEEKGINGEEMGRNKLFP